jgi:hypothetical protein
MRVIPQFAASTRRNRRNGVVLLLAVALLAVAAPPLAAMEKGQYEAPDMEGFVIMREEDGDGDGDGVKETHIRHFQNLAGDNVFSMTTKDTLWAWSMSSHHAGGGTDPAHNYVIRDSNCDGSFDERYGLDEEFHVPDCLEDNVQSKPAASP